jgi:hypothetical protein
MRTIILMITNFKTYRCCIGGKYVISKVLKAMLGQPVADPNPPLSTKARLAQNNSDEYNFRENTFS